MASKAHALSRDALIRTLTAYSGITTQDGAADGTTLIDSNLIDNALISPSGIPEKTVLILTGNARGEDKGSASFDNVTGEITLQGTGFSDKIVAGTIYRILNISSTEIDVARIEAKVDIIDTVVDAIKAITDVIPDAGALTALLADITAILADTGELQTDWHNGGRLDAILDAIKLLLDTPYTEASVSGNSGGDGAWHDALDVDTRGAESMSAVMINTHGANSLDWRIRARPSNYAAGADEEIPECPDSETLAPGEKGLLELEKAYSRIKIQVQDTVPASAATYDLDYLINR